LFFFLDLLCESPTNGLRRSVGGDEDKIKTRVPEIGPVSLHFLFRVHLGHLYFLSDDLPHNRWWCRQAPICRCALIDFLLIFKFGLITPAGFVAEPVGEHNGVLAIALSSIMSRLQPPQHSNEIKVAFPAEHVLLLTFNRPKQLNAMTPRMSEDLKTLLDWFEDEPSLWHVFYSTLWSRLLIIVLFFPSRVVIVTGEGRIFCAGADLKAYVWSIAFMQYRPHLTVLDGITISKAVLLENKRTLQPMFMDLDQSPDDS
jgi:hypothetical protein